MYSDSNLVNLRKDIFEFNRIMNNYVVSSSNFSVNEISLNIFCGYENKLKQITKDFMECGENKKENSFDVCIKNYQENFFQLRSEVSKEVDKEASRLLK